MVTARIVNGSQPQDCTAWVPPTMEPGVSRTAALTAAETDVIRRKAQADGYAAGRLEGLAAGRQEAQDAAARLALVLDSLSRPFAVLDAAVEQELVALAFALARQLVRRELKADPGQIVGIVRDALQSLPVATRDIKVHLNPEDAKLVRRTPAGRRPGSRLDHRRGPAADARRCARGHGKLASRRAAGDAASARWSSNCSAAIAKAIGRSKPSGVAVTAVELAAGRATRWAEHLRAARERIGAQRGFVVEGVLSRMVGLAMEATGVEAPVGTLFLVETADGRRAEAEVVGFAGDRLFLMPTGETRGLRPGARVVPARHGLEVAVGRGMLGRVIDGAGQPLDGLGRVEHEDARAARRDADQPARAPPDPRAARRRRALDQRAVHRGPRAAHRPVRRQRRRQERPARHDDALHDGRRRSSSG